MNNYDYGFLAKPHVGRCPDCDSEVMFEYGVATCEHCEDNPPKLETLHCEFCDAWFSEGQGCKCRAAGVDGE